MWLRRPLYPYQTSCQTIVDAYVVLEVCISLLHVAVLFISQLQSMFQSNHALMILVAGISLVLRKVRQLDDYVDDRPMQ